MNHVYCVYNCIFRNFTNLCGYISRKVKFAGMYASVNDRVKWKMNNIDYAAPTSLSKEIEASERMKAFIVLPTACFCVPVSNASDEYSDIRQRSFNRTTRSVNEQHGDKPSSSIIPRL